MVIPLEKLLFENLVNEIFNLVTRFLFALIFDPECNWKFGNRFLLYCPLDIRRWQLCGLLLKKSFAEHKVLKDHEGHVYVSVIENNKEKQIQNE